MKWLELESFSEETDFFHVIKKCLALLGFSLIGGNRFHRLISILALFGFWIVVVWQLCIPLETFISNIGGLIAVLNTNVKLVSLVSCAAQKAQR